MNLGIADYLDITENIVRVKEVSGNGNLSLSHISYLTFQAVFEVVIICFAGFIFARTGLLNNNGQKVLSSLNVDLFTPCLIFSKLAPSLSIQKMAEIVVIPAFYAISSGIAYVCSRVVSRVLMLNEPETDFVTAMSVFGNSNSLPVSLTLALAYTLPGLQWDDIEDDNEEKIASRGILYLLIFQQLGQILRWSWGYNKLLRSRSQQELTSYVSKPGDLDGNILIDEERYDDESSNGSASDNRISYDGSESDFENNSRGGEDILEVFSNNGVRDRTSSFSEIDFREKGMSFKILHLLKTIKDSVVVQKFLAFMNPPLYAMSASVFVASVPYLQYKVLEDENSFIRNTFTKSVNQLSAVSIPLILIVLGSNLYPSNELPPASRNYKNIIIGSLLSRMIVPPVILLPIIALSVKYIKISVLDDPIFLIVAFILTISPPAIQLSQIVQLNRIYQKEMSGVLFWGYVILTLPTTIFIVVASLEVLKWAS